MPMCASDIITMYNIIKQNINILALTFSAYYNVKCWRDKNKMFRQIHYITFEKISELDSYFIHEHIIIKYRSCSI